jgi:hypothetical protein
MGEAEMQSGEEGCYISGATTGVFRQRHFGILRWHHDGGAMQAVFSSGVTEEQHWWYSLVAPRRRSNTSGVAARAVGLILGILCMGPIYPLTWGWMRFGRFRSRTSYGW